MKKVLPLIVFILVLCGSATAQTLDGCAILFDNSNSMDSNFTAQQLDDAKQLVMDLIFEGMYNKNKWILEDGTTGPNRRIWHDNIYIYTHAFGEINTDIEPFFKNPPTFAQMDDRETAEKYIQKNLFDILNFQEKMTYLTFSKVYCWYRFSDYFQDRGKYFGAIVIKISDDIEYTVDQYDGIGREIYRIFNSHAQEKHLMHFRHAEMGRTNTGTEIALRVQIDQVSPHTLPPGTSRMADNIQIVIPKNNQEYDYYKDSVAVIQWESVGNFQHFIIRFYSAVPGERTLRGEIYSKQIGVRKTFLVPLQLLETKATAPEINVNSYAVEVVGVYPQGTYFKNSKKSQVVFFTVKKPDDYSWIWWLLLVAAVIGGSFTFVRKGGMAWMKEKMRRYFGRGDKPVGTTSKHKTNDRNW